MNLSTKKINVGIIGSSFSTGRYSNHQDHPFEKFFTDQSNSNYNFYNLACGGKATEKYLQSIVYLKKTHNIDILLFEITRNRSCMNYPISEWYSEKNKNKSFDDIKNALYEPQGYYHFEKHLQHEDDPDWDKRPLDRDLSWEDFAKIYGFVSDLKTAQHWQKIMIEINANVYMRQMTTVIDVDATLNLCDLLGIKHVCWYHNQFARIDLRCWQDVKKRLNLVKFNNFITARQYFEDKYPKQNILCDGVHFTTSIDQELVKDWLLPAVESVAKQINI